MDISNLATKTDIQKLATDVQRVEDKLDNLQNTLDRFVGIVDDLRTENTVGAHQTRELEERVDNLEKKVDHIEAARHVQ